MHFSKASLSHQLFSSVWFLSVIFLQLTSSKNYKQTVISWQKSNDILDPLFYYLEKNKNAAHCLIISLQFVKVASTKD